MPSARSGFQPRNTPAERRAFFDIDKQLRKLNDSIVPPPDLSGYVTDAELATALGPYATDADLAAATAVVRFQGSRANAAYPLGDTAIQPISTAENLGGFTVSTNNITFPVAGTYIITASIGGVAQNPAAVADCALAITTPQHSAVGARPVVGTGWRVANTLVTQATPGQSCSFTYRNQSTAALTLAFNVIIVKIA
jgi:hypothetical protein